MVPGLDRAGLLPRRGLVRQARLLHRHPPAERHRRAAHGPRGLRDPAGPACALEADERLQHPVAAGHRPRRHRHADGGGAQPQEERGEEPPRPRTRGVPQASVGVEGAVRRAHRRAAQGAGRVLRLGAAALHHGRGALPGGARGLRAAARGGAHLSGPAAHQLVPPLPHRAQRPRGGARGQERQSLAHRLPSEGLRREAGGRDHPPGDDARRHRGGGAPRGPALQGPHRPQGGVAAGEPGDPHHRGRAPGLHGVRDRRGEGHPRARLQRLRDRPAPWSGDDLHLRPGRPDQRECRRLLRAGPQGVARPRRGRSRGTGASGQDRGLQALAGRVPALRRRGRAHALTAVVREDRSARRAGDQGGGGGEDAVHPRDVDQHLLRLDAQPARLVHQPAALVGPPDPRVVLRLRRGHRLAAGPHRLPEVRRPRAQARRGRAGHLVLQWPLALLDPRLARPDQGPADLLPDHGHGDRSRHHLLLGGPDDDVRAALHEGRALPHRVPARDGARREGRQDVEGEGQRHRPARRHPRAGRRGEAAGGAEEEVPQGHACLRLRRAALHAHRSHRPGP